MLFRRRKSLTTIAKPMATSAAARVMRKKTNKAPSRLLLYEEKATKIKLTELSISSRHMNRTKIFFRMSSPRVPIPNSKNAKTKMK